MAYHLNAKVFLLVNLLRTDLPYFQALKALGLLACRPLIHAM